MKATCPGPQNSYDCENFSCRKHGCQGRLPEAKLPQPIGTYWREPLTGIERFIPAPVSPRAGMAACYPERR
jgi:hypothetical protein